VTAPDDGERAEILAEMAALARKLDPDPAAQLNEELAALREEIASLRQQIAAQPHHGCRCHHHVCWHYCLSNTWIGTGTTITYPQTWTISSGNSGTVTYGTGGTIS
jgi:hypothetical protein